MGEGADTESCKNACAQSGGGGGIARLTGGDEGVGESLTLNDDGMSCHT